MGKALKFIVSVILTCVIASGIVYGIWLLDKQLGFLSVPRKELADEMKTITKTLFRNVVTGVTVGAIALACTVFVVPLFIPQVDRKSYVKNVVLGMISSFVFWLSQTLYLYFEKVGGIIQIAAVMGLVFAGAVLVEFFALMVSARNRAGEFRTVVFAGITSGLLFSIGLSVSTALVKTYF